MPRRTRHGAGDSKANNQEASVTAAEPNDADSKISALVEELDVEVEARCKALQSDAERMAACIRSTYRMQLEKLPKTIRSMTVKEFFQINASNIELQVPELIALASKYGDTSSAVQEEVIVRTPLKVVSNPNGTSTVLRSTRSKSRVEPGPSDNQTKRKAANNAEESTTVVEEVRTTRRAASRKQSMVPCTPSVANSKTTSIVASTPAFSRDLPFTPAHHGGTVLRLPKRGESIFSTRGSPVAVVTSDASAQVIFDGHCKIAALAVGLSNGEEVNVANPAECAKMSREARMKAMQEVLAMQQQLEAVIANLRV